MKKGFIHCYTGDGKGKTTAALGCALRAAGHGMKTLIIQFMKGEIDYGEIKIKDRLAPLIEIKQMGRKCFVKRENPDPIDISMAEEAIEYARKVIQQRLYDIVVLDEVNVAVDYGLVKLERILDLLRSKPDDVEIILTGRDAKREVIELSDLVTEMKKIKHYFDEGVVSRKGIEV